ncbi:hypothetical protein DID88_002739 [Monilinia fructigena]|uniref:Nucleolar protein 12 n=1 Tax=Monilinia fructigena TaxID=38457 RepID=A0A395INF7_9HELO|nr:hypothetical protein DID88_002739 [Monilinia fructigena]
MVKRSRTESNNGENKTNPKEGAGKLFIAEDKAVDPTLALLFASSAGPVQAPPKSRYQEAPPPRRTNVESQDAGSSDGSDDDDAEDDEMVDGGDDLSSIDCDLEDAEISGLSDDDEVSNETPDETLELDKFIQAKTDKPERKRKRKNDEPDLEGKYLEKLAREEEKEEEELKEATEEDGSDEEMKDAESDEEAKIEEETDDSDSDEESHRRKTPSDVPLHESLVPNKDATELEKASPDKKTLMSHLSSFINDLPPPPSGKPSHKLESLRFRSTAYATSALPKKAAFAKKDIMTATTKSTNAYAVYSTSFAAREAVKRLNGTMVLDRHLRVDGVAHPAKTDHRRCVFVGNLGFVDDESLLEQDGENSRKRSKIPSDIEEGLWRQFGKAGEVESVRVIRDEKTRVGKGFAYVQFKDANAVEAALLFNEKKYPPMLPRVLRVVRAKAQHKQVSSRPTAPSATKLLGKAGGAKFKKTGANDTTLGSRGHKPATGDGEVKSGMAVLKMSGFSFSFAGDDIEIDSTQEALPTVVSHAAETGSLAPRKSSGAFPVSGQPLLPPTHHTVEELLKTLPSQIAYSTLTVKLDDGKEIGIPRRELWDVRAQLMAEDEGKGKACWESSVDLVKVLNGRAAVGEGKRRVLELGCGTALPSLAVFQWFLEDTTSSTSGLELGLADYNPTVLQLVTLPNVLLSWAQITKSESWKSEGELDIDDALIAEFISSLNSRNINLSLFSGAWSHDFVSLVTDKLQGLCENTTIIGAETIYSPVALRAFAETLIALLELSTGSNKTALVWSQEDLFWSRRLYRRFRRRYYSKGSSSGTSQGRV